MTFMRRVKALTFLNYFISGSVGLLIPLLLLARNVSLTNIGLVLSVLPLIFLVARLLFAAIADYVGWSHIFLIINWPTTVASVVIYYLSTSLPVFMVGRFLEGLRESSYWAVSRTAIFKLSPKREGIEATKMNAIIWLATAVGALSAGIGIAFLGFSSTLLILILISSAVGVPAMMLWRNSAKIGMPKTERLLAPLNPRGRPKKFWLASVALMFNSLAVYPLIVLVLPVFMNQELGYDYLTTGLLFMTYNAVSAAATFLSIKRTLSLMRALILVIVSVTASALMTISGFLFPLALLSLAFVRGFGISYFEHTVANVAKESKNLSVDVGLLHVPMRIAEFFSVLVAGFVVQSVGYLPVFLVTGACFGFFLALSIRVLST
jgi:MFS family permease